MLGMDTYWLVSEILLVVTFIAFLFTQVLMPSKKKVESGVKVVPSWIGFALVLMLFFTVGVGITAILLVEKNLVILISAAVLALALVLSLIEFFRIKGIADKMAAGGGIHHAAEVSQERLVPHGQQHFHHPYHNHQHMETPTHQPGQAPAGHGPVMTVECPQCGSHINLPEGSHQITCPYCGLSGTL
jgi:ribosomal protein S27E